MSKYQRFTMQTVKRSDIQGAVYNPRIISNQAKARLRRGLEENGLVQPLIWNKRTGNLVGGHQRLAILDDLEQGEEYELDVAVVDVDEAKERKLNVLLNNDSSMGHWDERKLLELFGAEGDVDYEAFGFSANQSQYFTNLIQQQELENQAVVDAMNDAIGFETELNISADEGVAERQVKKLERKQAFEQHVHELLVPQDNDSWKLKTDEEKKAFDTARTSYREEKFTYAYIKIAFASLDAKVAFLRRFNLRPDLEVIHESELGLTTQPGPGSEAQAGDQAGGGEAGGEEEA